MDACSSITESICDVVRTAFSGDGGSIVIIEVDGEKLWWRIWDSTAYFTRIVGKETCTLWDHQNSHDHLGKLYFQAGFCGGLDESGW